MYNGPTQAADSAAPLNSIQNRHVQIDSTATPAVIRRADYAPPAFLIDTVALEFDLVPERTVVQNTMRVRRNPDAARRARISYLLGEQLEFVARIGRRPPARGCPCD